MHARAIGGCGNGCRQRSTLTLILGATSRSRAN
jgi:hypothetical protein